MKIAFFTNNYLPNPYGVSMSIESFRQELEKHGHTVYVFAPKFGGYIDENRNVFRYPAIDLNFRNVRFPLAIPFSFRISKILKDLEIDIIHSQHPNLLGWAAERWAKEKKIPLVFTWHTLYDQYAHFAPAFIPRKLAAWWAIRNAVRYADQTEQVITPTPSVTKIIRSWGVKNPKIESIPSGVDENGFANADGEVTRKKLGIAPDETLLFFIGRITAEKNVTFLMEAVVELLRKNKKAKFVVCGGGDKIPELKKISHMAGASEQVIFTGLIGNQERKNYFAAADIFVYASKSETQGMILTEAMYMGVPVVAVQATGVKDLVINQVTGLLVKEDKNQFVSAVQRLLDDRELRARFSENAKAIASQNYTASVCAGKMLAVYQKAIGDFRG
jgi:glycosyltransferase involved in cell wall biosynthesis